LASSVFAGLRWSSRSTKSDDQALLTGASAQYNADGGALIPEGNGNRTYEVDVDTQQMSMLMLTYRNSEGYKHSTFA